MILNFLRFYLFILFSVQRKKTIRQHVYYTLANEKGTHDGM